MLYNPDFNCTEFGTIKNAAGNNNFVLSVKTWLERTNAVGIRSKAGRYGGTYYQAEHDAEWAACETESDRHPSDEHTGKQW